MDSSPVSRTVRTGVLKTPKVRSSAHTPQKLEDSGRRAHQLASGGEAPLAASATPLKSITLVTHRQQQSSAAEATTTTQGLDDGTRQLESAQGRGLSSPSSSSACCSVTILPDPFPSHLRVQSPAVIETHETSSLLRRHNLTVGSLREYVADNGTAEDFLEMLTSEQKAKAASLRRHPSDNSLQCESPSGAGGGGSGSSSVSSRREKLPWVGTAPPIVSLQSRLVSHQELLEPPPTRTIAAARFSGDLVREVETQRNCLRSGTAPVVCTSTESKVEASPEATVYSTNPNLRYTDEQGNLHLKTFSAVGPNSPSATVAQHRGSKVAQPSAEGVRRLEPTFTRNVEQRLDDVSDGFGTVQIGRCDTLALMRAKFDEWRLKFEDSSVSSLHWVPLLETLLEISTKPAPMARVEPDVPDLPALHSVGYSVASSSSLSSSKSTHPPGRKQAGSSLPPGGPHPLRVATAMFVVRQLFKLLKLPMSFLLDLENAVYVDGGAATLTEQDYASHPTHRGNSSDNSSKYRTLSVETDYLTRTLYHTALMKKVEAMRTLTDRTDAVSAHVRGVDAEVREARDTRRRLQLRFHFIAWKSVVFQQGSWKGLAKHYHAHRQGMLLKVRAFRAWKSFLLLKHIDDRAEQAENKLSELESGYKQQLSIMHQAAQQQVELEVQLKRSKSKEATISGEGVGALTRAELEQLQHAAERAASLEGEIASLSRRCTDYEGKAKAAIIEKEKARDTANLATEALRDALKLTLGGRQMTGVKASDILVNAEKMSSGALTQFHRTSVFGVDHVVAPIRTKGDHILLAWANAAIETSTGVFPRISHVALGMNDGRHYATLMKYIFPESEVGAKMEGEEESVARLNLFIHEGSPLMLGRAPERRQSSFSFSSTGGGVGGQSGAGLSRARRTASSFANNDPGPLIELGITAVDLADGREECHYLALFALFKCYVGRFSIKLVEDHRDAAGGSEGESATEGGGGFGAQAEETAESLSMHLQLATRSMASWRLLLEKVEDTTEQVMYRLALGQRAKAYFTDTRQDSVLSRFVLDTAAVKSAEDVAYDSPASYKRSTGVAIDTPVNRDEEIKRTATIAMCNLCVTNTQKEELVQCVQLEADTLSQVFENYCERLRYLTFARFEEFLKDCGAYEGGHLVAGSGDRLGRRFSTATKEEDGHPVGGVIGLHPAEFVAATVAVADELFRLLSRSASHDDPLHNAANQARTIAARFSLFISHYVQKNLRLSSVMNVRLLLQQSSLVAVIDTYRSALETLFGNVALRSSKQNQSAAEEFSLSAQDWLKFMRDLEMNDTWTSQKELTLIFHNSQDMFDTTSDSQMSFTEFLEAIIALAQFRCPNPYLNPAGKLRMFLVEKLLPQVKRKLPAIYPKMLSAMKVERPRH